MTTVQRVEVLAGPTAGAVDLEYHRPQEPAQVDELLAQHVDRARLLAGGTDLIVQMRNGRLRPAHVIDLVDVEGIDEIDVSGGRLRVGAGARLWDVGEHPVVRERFAPLREGARCVGSLQIQNRATLTGNACNASPAADTAPALLLYDAVATVRSVRGRRDVAIDDLWTGPGRTSLAADEWVEAITFADPRSHGAAYVKLGRTRGVDLAVVGVACRADADGAVRAAAVSVAPTPVRLPATERALAAPDASDDELAAAVAADIDPISDLRASREYRLAMTAVCARRAHALARARLEGAPA